MSEMIERVANVIEEWAKPYDDPFDRADFIKAARAVLEAMREHSPEQEKRMDVVLGGNTPATRRWHWVWYEMIDAALAYHPRFPLTIASEGMMDERTKRVAMAICGREASYQQSGRECRACREAHFIGDDYLPDVPEGCKGLGYKYLAEVAIKAADGT